ncbi:MAG: hypothetical protein VST67_14670 [Nitrospirota bacterium]|jgi:hypothetical protein|nr:hypothetical protein [Nitrospirota bacterium]
MATLTEFLRNQKAADDPERRTQRQKAWLSALDKLFQKIRSWLAEAEREKLIKVRIEKVNHTEESLGTFKVPRLSLTVDHKIIILKPIGATIIGADGRVDMVSTKGTYLFLYLADQDKWVHGSGITPSEFQELTEKIFTDLLKRALA